MAEGKQNKLLKPNTTTGLAAEPDWDNEELTEQEEETEQAAIDTIQKIKKNRLKDKAKGKKVQAADADETAAEKTANEEKATRKGSAKGPKNRWKPVLSYRWVMKNVSFFLFLAALAVVYIYNGHYADKIVRDINRTNKELKELQYEYKTLKSEVMFRSKQSELAKAVEPFGLKELTLPPVVLRDSIK
jgi:cell division protein FtsL